MIRCRRAVLLLEMLVVLLTVGVGGTLMVVALASIQRSQRRIADFDNRYAVLNDFVRCISGDVRKARTASLEEAGLADTQLLVLGEVPAQVIYRFYGRGVERTGFAGHPVAAKQWDSMRAVVQVQTSRASDPNGSLVKLTVFWDRADVDAIEPNRRFDFAVRCGAEVPLDANQTQDHGSI